MAKWRFSVRRTLDAWFPTVVRYAGICTFLYGVFIDRGHNPALIPAAGGMILFKTIYGNGGRQ